MENCIGCHGRLRDECLNVNWFANLWDAQRKIGAWRIEYNTERPLSSLGYLTPHEFSTAAAAAAVENGPPELNPVQMFSS